MKLLLNIKRIFAFLLLCSGSLPATSFADALKTGENFLVLGVIASSKEHRGVALLKNQTSKQTFAVKQGDAIGSAMKLVDVTRKFIEVDFNGVRYKLRVGDLSTDAQFYHNKGVEILAEGMEKDGDTIKVTAELKKHMITNELDKILMQAATVPYYAEGKLQGFTIWDIEPESVFEKFGLKNGDTITAINDFAINDLSSTLKLLTSLKDSQNASFRFLRQGEERALSIVVQ